MSRSGYTDDCENLELYRANVDRAIAGKRGQKLLRECLAGLDAMPEKVLIANDLMDAEGCVCTLGAAGQRLGIENLKELDPEDHRGLSKTFGAAKCLIAEIEYMNDEDGPWNSKETPQQRWQRMRDWLQKKIIPESEPLTKGR